MSLDFQAFGQAMQKIGKNMMQTAMFYGQSKMALHQSEFGFGSIWGGGYMGGCNGGYMGGCNNMWNMYNQQTLNFAYQQGYNEIAMRMQNVHNGTSGLSGTIPVEHTNNPAASAVPQGIDTKFGEAYEEAETRYGPSVFSAIFLGRWYAIFNSCCWNDYHLQPKRSMETIGGQYELSIST